MNEQMKRLYDWCHEQRTEAQKALALYEQGTMRFQVNHVDVTEEQKANLRRIIENHSALIQRMESADQQSDG